MGGTLFQSRARALGRTERVGAVRSFFLLAAIGFAVAALCGAALSWDGAIYLFELLDKQRPYVSQGRLVTWPLHLPVVLASKVTSDLAALTIVFGLVYTALPFATLAAAWWVVRDTNPALFIWPAYAFGLGLLPGQLNFIAEGNIALQLAWPVALSIIVGLPRRQLPLVAVLAVALFLSHPFAVPLFAALALLAVAGGARYADRRPWLWGAAVAFGALAAASALRFWLARTPYEEAQLSVAVLRWAFAGSVAGLPLVALLAALVAATLTLAVPLLGRRGAVGAIPALRIGELLAIGLAALALLAWARDPEAWRLAKEYHRFALFVSLAFLVPAALEGLGYGAALRRSAADGWAGRGRTLRAIGVAFMLVLVVQSVSWLNLTSDLRAAVNRSPWACVSLAPLGSLSGTALDDWPTAYLAMLQQGRTPGQVALPGDDCGTTDLAAGLRLNPQPGGAVRVWDTGWFDLQPVRERLLAERAGGSGCNFALTTGWHRTETNDPFWWRWSDGRNAQLRVTLDRPATVILRGEVETATAANRAAIKVNGQDRGAIDLPATGLRPLGPLSLPLRAGENVITFTSQNAPIPAAADGRPLAISVANLAMSIDQSSQSCAFHP
jgi:hypothetical protein